MRQHLMLNQSRLSTAEEVAQEIEDLLGCKVENLMECHTTLERVVAQRQRKNA